jgi:hypothetical protein
LYSFLPIVMPFSPGRLFALLLMLSTDAVRT